MLLVAFFVASFAVVSVSADAGPGNGQSVKQRKQKQQHHASSIAR